VFGKLSEEQILMEILNKGEYQVGDLEREANLDNVRKEVAILVANMCVDKNNLAPVPVALVQKMLLQAKIKLNDKQQPKKQALDVIKELQKVMPIKRAQMRILIRFENNE